MDSRIPTFIIAGTQKGGSTWLEHNLNRHSAIFTPRRQLHFFDREFERGINWYSEQFEGAHADQILGEKTTEYFDVKHADRTARRIAETIPNVKLIVMLRNPVDRAFSAYRHYVTQGIEPIAPDANAQLFLDLDKGMDGHRYIERGLYGQQMEIYLRHFAPEQILTLVLENDVREQPSITWNRVCQFLGVYDIEMSDLGKPVNRARVSKWACNLQRRLFAVTYARGAIQRLDRILPTEKWEPEFTIETRQKLNEYYRDDVKKLENLLVRRFDNWLR